MLRTFTAAEKYFHSPNRWHGYEDILACQKGETRSGVFSKHDLLTTNHDKSSE